MFVILLNLDGPPIIVVFHIGLVVVKLGLGYELEVLREYLVPPIQTWYICVNVL